MESKNKFSYTIQYQDLDAARRLRLYTLENYLLNSAGRAADQLGFGMHYLSADNMTWVLINLALEVDYLPTEGEVLEVETWIENQVHMLSFRNFRLSVNGKQIGQAKSSWTVINYIDRTIQNIFDRPVFGVVTPGEKLPIEQRRHIPSVDEPAGQWEHQIVYSDIDYNGHCNSCKYLEFMLNAVECPYLPLRLDIKYAKEVRKGDKIRVLYSQTAETTCYEVRTETGELSCSAAIAQR